MALSVSTFWEVRPTAGSDSNGGGFHAGASGTDFSQQNAAQYTFSDLASVSALVVSSASHNFVASDVGNIMQITAGAGFTTGFYEIVSVAINQATLDRSPGTVGTGGTFAVGGALATISQAITAKVQGNVIYVKASGTYTVTVTQNLVAGDGGTGNNLTQFIGYTTTRGDNGKATWTTATNSVDLITFAVANNFSFQNFNFTNTAGTKGNCFTAGTSGIDGNLQCINCIIDGFNIGFNGVFVGTFCWAPLILIGCVVKNCVNQGILNGYNVVMDGCFIHDNTGDGLAFNNTGTADQSASITRSAFYNNGGKGIQDNSGAGNNNFVRIDQCVFVSNVSHGVNANNGVASCYVVTNSIFDSNGGFGLAVGSWKATYQRSNAFFNNASGKYSGGIPATPLGEVILTGSPFTNPATGDFTLNSTAGAGAVCKTAAYLSAIPGGA
jgi:hypothetical protein